IQVDHVSLLLKFLKTRTGLGFLPNTVAKRLIQQENVINVPFLTEIAMPKRSIYLLKRKMTKSIENSELLIKVLKATFL
ncbi:hypothetical protein OSK18_28250, partial [Escherichia coli]|nr:hypothetical protein [Escherichia coli]